MGVHGMSSRAGFTTPNLMEAETNRAFVTATEHLVVLADHSKWGITGLSSMATLDDAAVLVTDRGLADSARAELGERVGRLVLADPAFAEDTDTADTSTHDRRRA